MKNLKRIGFLLLVAMTLVSCCDCPTGDPINEIFQPVPDSLESAYIQNQYQYINQGLAEDFPGTGVDSRAVYFEDIEDLERFLYKVKKKADSANIGKPGIYVNFGATKDVSGRPTSTIYLEGVFKPELMNGSIFGAEPQSLDLYYNKGIVKKPGSKGDK